MTRRQLSMGAALLATLLAVYWVAGLEEEDAVVPAKRTSTNSTARTAAPGKPVQAGKLDKRSSAVSQASLLAQLAPAPLSSLPALTQDPFAPASFEPPPPRLEPVKPSAPPLRFKYLGKVAEGDRYAVFLDDGSGMLVARQGDTLNNQYRVISVGERILQLEYLPLNTAQTLNY
ncbi:hypothetical protein GCM10027046_09250 [Uliginosibacterium flavum]|uniref:Secretion system X translation initiation factor n=1 Tax=Uliginosibacterium flavum TaxID=1396831 RepID=A0ABV2TKV4_9RHOO